MRILHVHNLMLRHYGAVKSYTGRKLSNGIIRGNHELLEFSDRDIVRFAAPLGIRPLGKYIVNRKLIETCDNFRPDLILLGHCDLIEPSTLQEIKKLFPETKIAHWFLDALWNPRNITRLQRRMQCTDAIFITTGGEELRQFCTGNNCVGYLPNPTDPAQDVHNNALKTNFDRDLIFCGVGLESDYRYPLLQNLHQQLADDLKFETYGILGGPPVWGREYHDLIARSKMGLNLNREEGWSLYSSDRISQLMGNGLLTFLWNKGQLDRLFTQKQVVFFNDEQDLVTKIRHYHNEDELRQETALNGYQFYHEHFSAQRTIKYIIEATFDLPFTNDYPWRKEVYR